MPWAFESTMMAFAKLLVAQAAWVVRVADMYVNVSVLVVVTGVAAVAAYCDVIEVVVVYEIEKLVKSAAEYATKSE